MARMTSGGDYGWRRRSRKAGRPGSTSERTRIEPGNCGRPDVFQGSRKGGIVRLSVEPKTQPKIEDDRSIVPAFYAAPRGISSTDRCQVIGAKPKVLVRA